MSTPYDLLFEMEKRADLLDDLGAGTPEYAVSAWIGIAADDLRTLVRFARHVMSTRDDLRYFFPNPAPNTAPGVILERLDRAAAILRDED